MAASPNSYSAPLSSPSATENAPGPSKSRLGSKPLKL